LNGLLILSHSTTDIVDNTNQAPYQFVSSHNYPNPFNAQTTFQYRLPQPSEVLIEIYDLLGRKVETLLNGSQPAGNHSISWNSGVNSSGVYFYKIEAGEFVETKKISLIK
jgi:flagellar hook assembly protein FlgD